MATVLDDLSGATPAPEEVSPTFEFKQTTGRYFLVDAPDGTRVSQHTDLTYALEAAWQHARANGINGTYRISRPAEWEVETMGFGVKSANSADILPPTQPSLVVATQLSGTSIKVTWGESTDASGVRDYTVSTGNVKQTVLVAAPREATFTGLTPGQTYTFSVSATDNAGNVGLPLTSNAVSLPILPDTTAPAVPTGLAATAISSTQINLAWVASNDPTVAGAITSGITGYKVYRNGTLLATVSGTSQSDTGLTASTQYSYRVSAVDVAGNESAQATEVSATTQAGQSVPGTWNPTYPRVAVYLIGTYTWTASLAQRASQFQLVILPNYPNAAYGSYSNITALGNAIKTYNSACKLIPYTIPTNVRTDSPWAVFRSKIESEQGANGVGTWYLKMADDSHVPPGTSYTVNITDYVTPDENGYRWNEWMARWYDASCGNGPWDGVFQDVIYWEGAGADADTADYDEDGFNEDKNDPVIEAAMIRGHVEYVDVWNALRPSWWVIGNWIEVSRYPVPSAWQQKWNGALQEFALGWQYSVEQWGSWASMMTWYSTTLSQTASPNIGILHATDDYLVSTYGFSSFRVIRYGLCSALMDNGWFAFSTSENHSDTIWADEYNWNLGYPTQNPQTVAYSLGVYLRQFDNGLAIVNPKGNGTRTVTLPDPGANKKWQRISGTQDPAINTGADVTSPTRTAAQISINERDGLILKRVNL